MTQAVLRSVVLLVIWTTAASAQPSPLPHVHFIATGGTISNRDPSTSLGAGGARLTAEDLVATAKGVDRYARVTVEQFSNVASSELTVTQWLHLSRRINEAFAGDKTRRIGVVIAY